MFSVVVSSKNTLTLESDQHKNHNHAHDQHPDDECHTHNDYSFLDGVVAIVVDVAFVGVVVVDIWCCCAVL